MSTEDGPEEGRGGGWLATVVGAGILLAAGFALGVVVGAVREEPALLLQYVRGEGDRVPAPAAGPVPTAPPGEEPPPAPAARPEGASGPPAPAPGPVAAGPAAPMIAPPGPGSGAETGPLAPARFAIQVGAFADSVQAEQLEERLRDKGLPVYLQPTTGAADARWRVRVGPVESRAEADRLASRLKSQDGLPVWVLEERGG